NLTTLDIATDGGDTAYNGSFGTGTTITLISDKKSDTVGINHTLGTMSLGGGTVNITEGANIASGSPAITVNTLGLTSGTAGAQTIFNPTTAASFIGAASISSTANAKTLVLDGTIAGNAVTGIISNGISGATLSLTKSNSSTWTLNGANTYTGATSLLGGT